MAAGKRERKASSLKLNTKFIDFLINIYTLDIVLLASNCHAGCVILPFDAEPWRNEIRSTLLFRLRQAFYLNVEKLFHAYVRAESGLGDDEAVLAHELEGDLVRQYGGIAVGNVGEGTAVHEHWSAFHRLHEIRSEKEERNNVSLNIFTRGIPCAK